MQKNSSQLINLDNISRLKKKIEQQNRLIMIADYVVFQIIFSHLPQAKLLK